MTNILFITGAGENIPYGFPSGAQLLDQFQRIGREHSSLKDFYIQGVLDNFNKWWHNNTSIVPLMELVGIKDADAIHAEFSKKLEEVQPTFIDLILRRNLDLIEVGSCVSYGIFFNSRGMIISS